MTAFRAVAQSRHEWDKIIATLMSAGLRQSDIAKLVQSQQSTMSKLLNREYREPGHALGDALLRLLDQMSPDALR